MKPVFIVNGFLESGKTEFICYTLAQPYFQTQGKTLLIVCEEGEEEYDDELLSQSRTIMEVIDEEAAFTPENLMELDKKYRVPVLLFYYERYSTAEIASILKIPEKTVSTRLFRAKAKLKNYLKEE